MRHGYADLIHRMKLNRFIPKRYMAIPRFKNLPPAERLRESFEELGPTFVKFGQLLASRPDLIPEDIITELEKLQDDVKTIPFPTLKRFMEKELDQPLEEIFESIEEAPMAAASIAQVHGAVLKTGERVAVKIQRPGVERIIKNDISILRGLATLLETYVPESQPFNPTGMVAEFFKTILYELDFGVEANNIGRIRKNMEVFPKVAVPKVYSDFSTSRILVLERFEGVRFSDREAVLVLQQGAAVVRVGTVSHDLRRRSVFDERASAVFFPADESIEISARESLEAIVVSTTAEGAAESVVIGPDRVAVIERGRAGFAREVHNILVDARGPQRLIVGETFNPPGNWSSFTSRCSKMSATWRGWRS